MRKRSHKVPLSIVASIASAHFSGCETLDDRRCVDENQVITFDAYCESGDQFYQPYSPKSYHWYYGGIGSGYGSKVTGGTFQTPTSRSLFRSSSRSGGSFTSSGSSRGLFGGNSSFFSLGG